jgi:rhamnosyltransferase
MADIIIPVYKPDTELIDILNSLSKQTHVPDKIILMNTEKQYLDDLFKREGFVPDESVEIHNITKAEFDHGGTRAAGVGYSESDIFICMTQDAVPADEFFIENIVRPLTDYTVAVSYARQLPKEGSGIAERTAREFNYPDESVIKSREDLPRLGIKTFFCSNVACAYKRDVYDRLGGFIEKTIFNEDMIYASAAIRAGYKIAYSADARVYHSHNYTARQQFRRNIDLGLSQAEHPEVFAGLSSESEGKKLVMLTFKRMIESGELLQIPVFIWNTVARYTGYLIGKNHDRFSIGFIKRHSMNPEYFKD